MKLNKKHLTFFTLASIAFHSEAYDANMDIRSIKKMGHAELMTVLDNYQTNYKFFDNMRSDSIDFSLGDATAHIDLGEKTEKDIPTRALNAACINSFLYVNNAKYRFIEEKLLELSVISDVNSKSTNDLKNLKRKGVSQEVINDFIESTDVQISLIKKHQKEKYNNFQNLVMPHIEDEVEFFEEHCDDHTIDKNTFVSLYNNKGYSIDSLYEFELGLESRSDRSIAQRQSVNFFNNGSYMTLNYDNAAGNLEKQNMCLDYYGTFVAYDQYKSRLGYTARNALYEPVNSDSFAFEAIERTRSKHVPERNKKEMKERLASIRLRNAEKMAEFESLLYGIEKYSKTLKDLEIKYEECHTTEIDVKNRNVPNKYSDVESEIGVPRF